MKFGVTGNLNLDKLALYRAGLSSNFQEYANEDFIKDNLSGAIQEAKSLGFINKGISKKTKAYKDNLVKVKKDNYLGKWYESGWYVNKTNEIYFTFPRNGSVFFDIKNNQFPYTNLNNQTTGVYINLNWQEYSGNQKKSSIANDQGYISKDEYVVGGWKDANTIEVNENLNQFNPYRNHNEIFDHRNYQTGDMLINVFVNKYQLPEQGEKIGYNQIFFMSGLTKENIDENTNIFYIPSTDLSLNSNFNRVFLDNKRFNFSQDINHIRYLVFFYTGDLPFIYTTGSNYQALQSGTVSFGSIPQFKKNQTVTNIQNNIFSINVTGIYPETFYKTFSIYNTGSNSIRYLVGVKNEYSDVLKIKNKEKLNKSTREFYSNEDIAGIKSGTPIFYGELTSKANTNFEVEISTTGLKQSVNNTYTGYVDIYTITGTKQLGRVNNWLGYYQSSYGTGFLYKIDSFPVRVNLKDNGTRIIKDDYYFNYNSINKIRKKLKTNENITFSSTGFLNIENFIFGLTFYSTGSNLTSSPVLTDLNNKIYRLNQYSNTGIYSGLKNIYPILSGEAYLNAKADVPWIEILNPIQNFRWVSGFSGLFDSNNYNPYNGALQQDLVFKINPLNLLPSYPNTGAENNNFIISVSGDKILLNGEILKETGIFKENKNYRFLQKELAHTNKITILNKPIKEYIPEYNKQNYRLFEINPNYKYYSFPEDTILSAGTPFSYIKKYAPNYLYFSGSSGNFVATGRSIIYPTKKNVKYSGDVNNEWYIYTIQPNEALSTTYLPVKDEIPSLLERWNFTGIRKDFSSVMFYPKLNNVRIITERNKNTLCRSQWRIAVDNTTGCYTNEQALNILSRQFINGIKNPNLELEINKNYHFIRVAATEKEISGAPLHFYCIKSGTSFEAPFQTGLTEEKFQNYQRITYKTNPNLITGFFNGSNKYFEYITFRTPSYLLDSIDSGNYYTYRPSGVEIMGLGNKIYIYEDINTSKSTGYYENALIKPIFSGNIYVYNSDIQNNKIQIPIIISGVNNIDYIKL